MEEFGQYSFAVSFLTSFILIYIYKKERFLIIKPSIWFLFFYHVFIQWSASFYYEEIYERLNQPYKFFILTQIIPFIVTILTRYTFRTHAFKVWKRINLVSVNIQFIQKGIRTYSLGFTFICFSIIGIYLIFVPLTSTGLYVGLTSDNPLLMSIAREKSMKLLPITWLKYLFALLEKFLAPVTVSLLTILGYQYNKEKKRLIAVSLVLMIFTIVLGVMLPGPRLNGVLVLLCSLITLFFINIKSVNILKYVVLSILILIPAVIIQMQKYTDVEQGLFWVAFEEVFLRRALYVPMEAGIYWLDYVEDHGFWGPAGIPKLAAVLGIESIHVPNFLMQYNFNSIESTGYLTASYMFSYYCYFGPYIYPFLVFSVLALDFWVIGYRFINSNLLMSSVIAINLITLVLTSTDYITLFISYGFLTGLLITVSISGFLTSIKKAR